MTELDFRDPALGLRAKANLLYIADRWADLHNALMPGRTGSQVRTKPTSRPPLNVAVADIISEVTQHAEIYAHMLMDETGWVPTTSAMPGLLREVAERYGHWMGGDDERAALDFSDWAEAYSDRVLHALNPPEKARYLGPCMVPNCDGELRLREDHHAGTCPACESPFTLDEYRRWLDAQFAERLMDRSEVCAALVMLGLVHTDRVHKRVENWIARGQLTDRGGLYSLAEAKGLAEKGKRWVRVGT